MIDPLQAQTQQKTIQFPLSKDKVKKILWKLRQFCRFWQPIVALTTAIFAFLLMILREFASK